MVMTAPVHADTTFSNEEDPVLGVTFKAGFSIGTKLDSTDGVVATIVSLISRKKIKKTN